MARKKHYMTPVNFYLLLILITIIISSLFSMLGWQADTLRINSATLEVESAVVTVDNLLSVDGLRYMITNVAANFVNFAPLGMLIIALIGISVALKSGLLKTVLGPLTKKIPNNVLTFIIVFLGVLGSIHADSAYVFLIPLSAIVFMINKRHPIAGMCAAFSGITGGYAAYFIATSNDSLLRTYTLLSANVLDPEYTVGLWSDIIVMVIAVFVISFVGTYITEKFIVRKLGKYNFDEEEETVIGKKEKRGLVVAGAATLIMVLLVLYTVIPGIPGSGILLDLKAGLYIDQLFGYNSYFGNGLTFIISLILIIAGLLYGMMARTIKTSKDFSNCINDSLNGIGNVFVLLFFASQFISILKRSNLGSVISASLINFVESANMSGIVLIIAFILVVAVSNLLIPSTSTKWLIFSPVIVPIFMQGNMSPEFAAFIFKASDSMTKGITPVLAYFAVFIGFIEIYNNKSIPVTINKVMSLLYPYTLGFIASWLLLILAWYIIGIPVGFNVFPAL